MTEFSKEETVTEVLMRVTQTAAVLLTLGKHDGVYIGGLLIWEVLKYFCHDHEFLLVVAPEKKRNHVLFK